MFIHPYFAQQRHHDLIATAETARLAGATRRRRPARPHLRRASHLKAQPAPLTSPAPPA